MKRSAIEISVEILNNYPEVAIGYLVVGNLLEVAQSGKTQQALNTLARTTYAQHIDLQTLVEVPQIAVWRRVYEQCGVKPKTYKSSIESLMRRFIKGDYQPIIPLVDLYNYISAQYLLSAGGYNWQSLLGTLVLRYGNEHDKFVPLSGKEDIPVNSSHILYADEHDTNNVVCWMWNHKDSRRTMLTEETEYGLFLFDCLRKEDRPMLEEALNYFSKLLKELGGDIKTQGIIDQQKPMLLL